MSAEPPSEVSPKDRRVRRGEGEVHQWPRGLVDYRPSGPPEAGPPSEEEDRTAQRIHLAARLIHVLRSRGIQEEGWMESLHQARRAYDTGDRILGDRLIDDLLGELDARTGSGTSPRPIERRQP